MPFSRSVCTERTIQRRQKPLVPSTYAPLKKVLLNASNPPGFNTRRISFSTCSLSGMRWMAFRKPTVSADLTSFDNHSALPWTNSASLEEIAARAFCRANGDGSTPMTRGGGCWSCTRSRMSSVTAPGPQPRSTMTWRPGQITRSRIQRLTYEKNGCRVNGVRSEEHTSELQSPCNLVCRLLLEKKKKNNR